MSGSLVHRKMAGIVVGFCQKPVDGGLEGNQGMNDAALQPPFGQLGEKAFDSIEPGGRGRGEMEGPARMPTQPLDNLGMLVGGVVVQDDVDQLPGRDFRLDRVEVADELLVPVSLTSITMPVRITLSRTPSRCRETQIGLFHQILSTRSLPSQHKYASRKRLLTHRAEIAIKIGAGLI